MKTKLPQVGICSRCQRSLSQTCGSCPQKMNIIPASYVLFGENNVPALADLFAKGPGYVTRGVDVFMKEVHPPAPPNNPPPADGQRQLLRRPGPSKGARGLMHSHRLELSPG